MTHLAYPSDPELRQFAQEADAIELLEQLNEIPMSGDSLFRVLQEVLGAHIVGDPSALDDYNDAKETIARAAEITAENNALRKELAETVAASHQRIRELEHKLSAVEWALKRAKGSKLEAVRQAIATN